MKKIFSFFLLLLFLFSTPSTLAFSESVYPFDYRNFYPQEDGKVSTSLWVKSFISPGTEWNQPYLKNILAIHSARTTPGYAPQTYTILPQDLEGMFGDITLLLRNFNYDANMWDKLRPVVYVEYRDENNSPMYNASAGFNPLAHSVFGMWRQAPTTANVPGNWYRTGNSYAMDIPLPMSQLSNRANHFDPLLQNNGIDQRQAKLKYIKVTVSLVSLAQDNGASYLSCQRLRPNNLVSNSAARRTANPTSYGGLGNEDFLDIGGFWYIANLDAANLYFSNGAGYGLIHPVSLGSEFYTGAGWNDRLSLQRRAIQRLEEINNMESYPENFRVTPTSDFPTGSNGNAFFNPAKSENNSFFLNSIFEIRGDFAIEDCIALGIAPASVGQRANRWRPEYIGDNPDLDIDLVDYNGDGDTTSDSISYRAHAPGMGFWYIPLRLDNQYNSITSSWSYNIGLTASTPNYIAGPDENQALIDQELSNMSPPKFLGWFPSYDWNNERPLVSQRSFSAELSQQGIQRVLNLAQRYCENSIIDPQACLNIHGLDLSNDGTAIAHSNPASVRNTSDDIVYTSALDIFSANFNDNYGLARDLITNQFWTNADARTFSEFEKLMQTLRSENSWDNIGSYARSPTFFSTVPRTTRENLEQVVLKEDLSDRILPQIDDSFQWQTLFPFASATGYPEANPWLNSLGYNLSLLKGTKYFYFGTYDLDKDVNDGIPPTDVSILFRPAKINSEFSPNSSSYMEYGPAMIKIDGVFDIPENADCSSAWGDSYLRDTVATGQFDLTFPNLQRGAAPINEGCYGKFKNIPDRYDNNNPKTAYVFPGPEGNDDSTFYKISVQALYNHIMNSSNWSDEEKEYLRDWEFDSQGALESSISFRVVILNPDKSATGAFAPNIIYLISNGAVWNVSRQLPDGEKNSLNLSLISSSRDMAANALGMRAFYFENGEDILESRSSSEIREENTLVLGYRLEADGIYNTNIINPYLLEHNLPDIITNLESMEFSSEEVSALQQKRVLSDGDPLEEYDIDLYDKYCIQPTQLNFQDVDGVNKRVLEQYVCYYVLRSLGLSQNSLQTTLAQRILTSNNQETPDYLPFVDIYTKHVVPFNLQLLEHVQRPYNILASVTEEIEDSNGNNIRLPITYDNLVNEENKDNNLVIENSGRLIGKTPFERFFSVPYDPPFDDFVDEEGETISWADANNEEKRRRVQLPVLVYFEALEKNGIAYTFNNIGEHNKVNNHTLTVTGQLDEGVNLNGDIRVSWDYERTDDENDNALFPNPADGFNKPVGSTEKEIGESVIVYPIVENTGERDICDVRISGHTRNGISVSLIPNTQSIQSNLQPYISNTDGSILRAEETIHIEGDYRRDLQDLNDFRFAYILDDINNQFSYRVSYKFCGDEALPYQTQDSNPISFRVEGSLNPDDLDGVGAQFCHLNDTLPASGESVLRSQEISYQIICTNITTQDVYDVQIRLRTPDDTQYISGIDDRWITLWTMSPGQVISYQTNPLDLIKKASVRNTASIGTIIPARLEFRYKERQNSVDYIERDNSISHRVEGTAEDTTSVEVLRGACNQRTTNTYPLFPHLPQPGMCVAKIDPTNAEGQSLNTPESEACLIVRYYRLWRDTQINDGAVWNPHPNLNFGQRANNNNLRQCASQNSTAGGEGAMRSKYHNVDVSFEVSIPDIFETTGIVRGYSDYNILNATNLPLNIQNLGNNTFRYTSTLNSLWTSEAAVSGNNFQRVLRDGASDPRNSSSLNAALVELRIPLRAVEKGSAVEWDETNFFGESVSDGNRIRIRDARINFSRQLWDRFDNRSYCQLRCVSWSMDGCRRYRWFVERDGTSVERSRGFTTGLSFPQARLDDIGVCVSSAWEWIQVLNGGMFVRDLSNLQNIEHQVDPNNPASYNTNWFYNQQTTSPLPGWFLQADRWENNLFNLDYRFTTKMCYPFNRTTNEYNYNAPYSPNNPNNRCEDGTKPWFYYIIDGHYGFLYDFWKQQLRNALSSTLDLSRDLDTGRQVKDRVWIYEQVRQGNEDLVIGDGINTITTQGLGSIFVTNDMNDLHDRSSVVSINSNMVYSSNEVTIGDRVNEYDGDAVAIVINGDLRISSNVEKIEALIFVDGDVYIEEGRNMLEIGVLYATWDIYVRRTLTQNSSIDRFTGLQERPVLRVTWDGKRYYFLTPKIMLDGEGFERRLEVPANDLNIDCIMSGACR